VTDLDAPARGSASRPAKSGKGLSPIARLRLFIRQVIDEMRKVVRPTRDELINYTLVVIVFVTFMMALTSGLDFGFSKLVMWVFGG